MATGGEEKKVLVYLNGAHQDILYRSGVQEMHGS